MKFSGNAHNTMPYMQVTFFKRSSNSRARGMRIKYKIAHIDNDDVLKFGTRCGNSSAPKVDMHPY